MIGSAGLSGQVCVEKTVMQQSKSFNCLLLNSGKLQLDLSEKGEGGCVDAKNC